MLFRSGLLRLEREVEGVQKSLALLVGGGGGHDGDVHTTGVIDLVEVDLREDELLGDAHGEVATAVEALSGDAAEVADARNGDGDQAIEELPHAVATEGDLGADGHAGAELERSDGLAGLGDQRLLAGDSAQVGDGTVDGLGVSGGLADSTEKQLIINVQDDGIGMDESDLQSINQKLRQGKYVDESTHGNGIALININQRIILNYGERYGITLASTKGVGSEVELTLPIIRDQDT